MNHGLQIYPAVNVQLSSVVSRCKQIFVVVFLVFFFFGFCIQSHCRWGRFLSYYHYQAMVSALLARLYLITTRLFFLNNIAQCYGKSC